MNRTLTTPISLDSIWFGLLSIYIAMGYFAQDTLLPSSLSSLSLYVFLAFSAMKILFSRKIRVSPIVLWGIIFLYLSFFSILYAPQGMNFGGTYYALIVNFVLIFILTQMPWTKERFDYILKVFILSTVGLLIILAMTGNLNDTSESGRLGQELMGNANIFAMMLMVSAIYALYHLFNARRAMGKLFCFLSVIGIYIGMFLSGGRKYVIVPIVFLYVFWLVKGDKKGKKHLLRTTLVIVIVVYAIFELINSPLFYDSIGQRFDGFFALFDDSYDLDSSTKKRQLMIKAAWEGWLEKPLLGHGFDSFMYYNEQSVTHYRYYSHNNFVELLYNQGLLGFIGYYSFYAYLMVKAWKKKELTSKAFVLATIFSLLLFEYVGITYSATPAQFLLFFCSFQISLRETGQQTPQ